MHGANRSGRPFTGDYAGILLYDTLHRFGYASAPESLSVDDGLTLSGCRITNAVKCLPPANKPEPGEIRECNRYLAAELAALPRHASILALGQIAHQSVLRALGLKLKDYPSLTPATPACPTAGAWSAATTAPATIPRHAASPPRCSRRCLRKFIGRVNTNFTPATRLIRDAGREARRVAVPFTASGSRQRDAPESARPFGLPRESVSAALRRLQGMALAGATRLASIAFPRQRGREISVNTP